LIAVVYGMPEVYLENISKKFADTIAVDRVTLKVRNGELLILLGPSGCGKTTTLRIVAGLLKPDEGDIYFDDEAVTHLPPEKRNVGMVFQNYALWPHMTVYENIAFGLRIRKLPESEIKRKVREMLELVKLPGVENRYPKQLSGGQQQRVALARALVIEPKVLLLDEPLSNLDAKLREEMRFEIKDLQRRLGITTIYVTHDQAEAMVLADRIAIMNRGKIIQVGSPEEIYERPGDKFVASFIGIANFIEGVVGEVDEDRGRVVVVTKDHLILEAYSRSARKGQRVSVMIRPEHVTLMKAQATGRSPQPNVLSGKVLKRAYLGDAIEYRVQVGENVLRVRTESREVYEIGEVVELRLDSGKMVIFPE